MGDADLEEDEPAVAVDSLRLKGLLKLEERGLVDGSGEGSLDFLLNRLRLRSVVVTEEADAAELALTGRGLATSSFCTLLKLVGDFFCFFDRSRVCGREGEGARSTSNSVGCSEICLL